MTADEFKPQLKQMLVERLFLDIDPQSMEDEAPLMETYGIDSVALFEVVVGLEEDFGVVIEEDEFQLELFANVNTITEFCLQKLAE